MATKRPGAPDWARIDWSSRQRWVSFEERLVNVVAFGSGDLEPIVFVHGVDGCWTDWLEQVVAFGATRRVVAIDLPGFGWSEPAAEAPDVAGYAHCVAAVCSALGIERAVVCGHSMGGVVACEMAVAFPRLVSRLVLGAPALLWRRQRGSRPLALGRRLLGRWSDWAAARSHLALAHPRLRGMALSKAVAHPDRLAPETAYEMLKPVGTSIGLTAALHALWEQDVAGHLGGLVLPCAILWGEADGLMPVAFAAETAGLIAGASLERFDDTGHCLQLEAPERFNAAVAEFLSAGD